MACSTSKIKITSSFCNNLFRSPVEFAQGALSVQQAAQGRFEAGLGAGWAEAEMKAIGIPYPEPPERIGMYIEAMNIAGQIIKTNQCQFSGDYYQIDISGDNFVGPQTREPTSAGRFCRWPKGYSRNNATG